MGLFKAKLPPTSYGYQPPPGARANGWRCPNPRDCGQIGHEAPRRWPVSCPNCGTQVDPTFEDPWGHDARRLELDFILADPQRDSSFKRLMRVESDVWYYKEALITGNAADADAARHDLRLTTAELEADSPYFISGQGYFQIVTHGLEYGDISGVADELLAWYPTVNTDGVDNDNSRRTTSRQFVASCIRFLEHRSGSRHTSANAIYQAMEDVAIRIKDVLTADLEEGLARVWLSRS